MFVAPIRAEFEAHCLPDGVLDIAPCILTEGNTDNRGFGLVLGTDFNRATLAFVFGSRVNLPHTPLKANETHKIVLTVDEHGNADANLDGKLVYKTVAPKGAKLAGHVIIDGGRGDVVYTKVIIIAGKAPPM
jgi:hypothetical protein